MNTPCSDSDKISSMYWHFPFCKHLCNYCDFYKLKIEEGKKHNFYHQFAIYLDKSLEILLEMLNQEHLSINRKIETLYMGGGTPSLWGETGIHFINDWLKKYHIEWAQNHECTLEVDPGTTSETLLREWQKLGVNRFSVGVQTLNPQIFQLMDRSHQLDQVYEILQLLKNSSVNFSVDFMLGLPQSEKHQRSIKDELSTILTYSPQHISLYFLTVPKNYKYFSQLPADSWIEKEYLEVIKILTAQGYQHYEVASFAKPGFHSKHNQKYWTHQSVLALGPSATGFLSSKQTRYKWQNNWIDKEGKVRPQLEMEKLSASELEIEWVYLTLRQGKPFGLEFFRKRGFKDSLLRATMHRWESRGYVKAYPDDHYKFEGLGWLILDSLVQELLTCK